MPTRHPSGPLCLAATALLCAATSSAQNTAGAQTSGQEAVAADRSGASAQGSAAGAAHADDTSANLASGSSVNAVLTKPVDSRHTKPGDPVSARTTQNARTEGGTSIPRGSTLVGHVSDAYAAAEGRAGSSVGIVFDKAVTRDGHEIALRNVGIQAVAAAEASAASSAGEVAPMTGAMTSAGGGADMSRGGGLLGRTTGGVGGRRRYVAGGSRGDGRSGRCRDADCRQHRRLWPARLEPLRWRGGCGHGLSHDIEREERASGPGHALAPEFAGGRVRPGRRIAAVGHCQA